MWRISVDGRTLVSTHEYSGNYQVPLAELQNIDDARVRVAAVVRVKDAWADGRTLEDLCRAIRELKGFDLRGEVQRF